MGDGSSGYNFPLFLAFVKLNKELLENVGSLTNFNEALARFRVYSLPKLTGTDLIGHSNTPK